MVLTAGIMADFKKIGLYFLFCVFIAGCHTIPVPQRKKAAVVSRSRETRPGETPSGKIPEEVKPGVKEPREPAVPTTIKIGVIESAGQVVIGAEDNFLITDVNTGGQLDEMSSDNIYSVKISAGKIIFDKKQFHSKIKIIPKNPSSESHRISVNGRMYRGNIILRRQGKNNIAVINELGLEEYICGVVPMEVGPDWPHESLKAQSVVARTFALKNLNRHLKEEYNLCSRTHCQVYGGSSCETAQTNKAVYETANEVIAYGGEMINSYYHASCAGYTEDVNSAWNISENNNPEYLSGVKCKFCEDYRWYNWEYKILFDTIVSRLRGAGYSSGKIEKIKAAGHTSGGRVKQVLIKHSKGELRIPSGKFRTAIGSDKIRSTNFVVKYKNRVAYFNGHGWGHGVGMCQWGAKGMAESGRDYKEILEHYYKNTKVIKMNHKITQD